MRGPVFPKDYSNTPEDYSGPRERRHIRMSETRWKQIAVAKSALLVAGVSVLVVGVWLTVSGAAGLWIAYFGVAK